MTVGKRFRVDDRVRALREMTIENTAERMSLVIHEGAIGRVAMESAPSDVPVRYMIEWGLMLGRAVFAMARVTDIELAPAGEPKMPEEIARLLRVWEPGDRCFAVMDITYASAPQAPTIKEGHTGTVLKVLASRVVIVEWDGIEALDWNAWTSPDCIDPVLQPPLLPAEMKFAAWSLPSERSVRMMVANMLGAGYAELTAPRGGERMIVLPEDMLVTALQHAARIADETEIREYDSKVVAEIAEARAAAAKRAP
jgi:hypothetical protein